MVLLCHLWDCGMGVVDAGACADAGVTCAVAVRVRGRLLLRCRRWFCGPGGADAVDGTIGAPGVATGGAAAC